MRRYVGKHCIQTLIVILAVFLAALLTMGAAAAPPAAAAGTKIPLSPGRTGRSAAILHAEPLVGRAAPDNPEDEDPPDEEEDDETKIERVLVSPATIVSDIVTYTGLQEGENYLVRGTLVDPETNAPVLIDGNPVTQEKNFTAGPGGQGDTVVKFEFNSCSLAGKTLVVYEQILSIDDEEVLLAHEDSTDVYQKFRLVPPELKTTAMEKDTEKKNINPAASTTIVDTIEFTGAAPGAEYTINGRLMLKPAEEGEEPQPVMSGGTPVTGTVHGTIPASGEGTATITYTFPTTDLGGQRIVAFAEMEMGGSVVQTHNDIKSGAQTVTIIGVEVATKFVAADDTQTTCISKALTLTDKVTYENLAVGTEYVLRLRLVDTSGEPILVDGNPVSVTHPFTPTQANDTEDVEITFNAMGLKGKTIVAYEELLLNGKVIGGHQEVDDKDQQVTLTEPTIQTRARGVASETVRVQHDIDAI